MLDENEHCEVSVLERYVSHVSRFHAARRHQQIFGHEMRQNVACVTLAADQVPDPGS